MDSHTVSILLDLNRQFYQTFGNAFAATRRRIQPGVRQVLEQRVLARQAQANPLRWLDIGCGSGALAREWLLASAEGAAGLYWGLDFSPVLLAEARQAVQGLPRTGASVRFDQADLLDPAWAAVLGGQRFDLATAFAVLHHIPGEENRLHILQNVRARLEPGGLFVHSEWQFQHSPKLMARRVDWGVIGLDNGLLEEGDTLLDWRAVESPGSSPGHRYVHLFSREELTRLASASGFEIIAEFESDGREGNLGLYQTWQAAVNGR